MSPELADAVVAKAATTLLPGVGALDDTLDGLLDAPPRTFRDWARDHAAAFASRG